MVLYLVLTASAGIGLICFFLCFVELGSWFHDVCLETLLQPLLACLSQAKRHLPPDGSLELGYGRERVLSSPTVLIAFLA